MSKRGEQLIREALLKADIQIDGDHPWDIQVHHPNFFKRIIRYGELGFGEAYLDRWWECEQLDELIYRLLIHHIEQSIPFSLPLWLRAFCDRFRNLQSKSRAFQVGQKHYDLGNPLFEAMLDKRMNYSCAYWNGAQTLEQAQENKLDLICRKLDLKPGMRVLDIGCGWGAFGKYAATKYGVEVVGITVSKEQLLLGEKMCSGLPVTFQLSDYRDLNGVYDRIVSVGMVEHVGYRNYPTYFEQITHSLKANGLFLLHTIGHMPASQSVDRWTHKYVFPNGMIPSIEQLSSAFADRLVLEDWHCFGDDYEKTLKAWYANFLSKWDQLKENYPDPFFRLWKFYLLSSAASFRARRNHLWQIVLSKQTRQEPYLSVR